MHILPVLLFCAFVGTCVTVSVSKRDVIVGKLVNQKVSTQWRKNLFKQRKTCDIFGKPRSRIFIFTQLSILALGEFGGKEEYENSCKKMLTFLKVFTVA